MARLVDMRIEHVAALGLPVGVRHPHVHPLRQILAHRIIQGGLALLHKLHHGDHGHQLGARIQAVIILLRDRHGAGSVLVADHAPIDRLMVLRDDDIQPFDTILFFQLVQILCQQIKIHDMCSFSYSVYVMGSRNGRSLTSSRRAASIALSSSVIGCASRSSIFSTANLK